MPVSKIHGLLMLDTILILVLVFVIPKLCVILYRLNKIDRLKIVFFKFTLCFDLSYNVAVS